MRICTYGCHFLSLVPACICLCMHVWKNNMQKGVCVTGRHLEKAHTFHPHQRGTLVTQAPTHPTSHHILTFHTAKKQPSILKNALFSSSIPYTQYRAQIQALRLKDTSINSHLPLCEPGPCNPQRGWETPRIVERSFTPLRWSHESKLPIKKQLQAAAGADSCSH